MPSLFRLALLVLEGYAYLGLVVAVFPAVVAFLAWGVLNRRPLIALVALLIGVPLIVTTGRAVRALMFAVPEPSGIAVTPARGGALHAAVEDIRARIGAPRVHRILVTGSYNASALQVSRAGIFWPRNMLLLGYPVLAIVSPEQARAVIAHELGHITHSHGRVSSWVYRTRMSWVRLIRKLEEHGAAPAHAYVLFRWYVPRLQAMSAAISRQQELLADRLAASVTSPETTAQALVAIEVGGDLLSQTFWPRIFARVADDPAPPCPFAEMGPHLWATTAEPASAELLNGVLDGYTEPGDTHPCLRDRLERLGQPARLPEAVSLSAADHFLGEAKPSVVGELDRDWQAAQAGRWRAQHDRERHDRERLALLAALQAPSPDQIFELAQLTERKGDHDAALSLYRAAHAAGHPPAGLSAGRMLLDREDRAGIPLIEAAMAAEPALVQQGCTALIEFAERHGGAAAAHQFKVRQARDATMNSLAAAERLHVTAVDRFVPCGDQTVDAASLAGRLAAERAVLRAFLVTKELRHPHGTQTVLALLARGQAGPDVEQRLRRDGVIPGGVTFVVLSRHDQQLQAALADVPGALIYERTS